MIILFTDFEMRRPSRHGFPIEENNLNEFRPLVETKRKNIFCEYFHCLTNHFQNKRGILLCLHIAI